MAYTVSYPAFTKAGTASTTAIQALNGAYLPSYHGSKTTFTNVNTSANLMAEETLRIETSRKSNIYNGLNINANQQLLDKSGTSLLVQVNNTLVFTPDTVTDGTERVAPISAHLVMTVPNSALITETVVDNMLKELLCALTSSTGALSIMPLLQSATRTNMVE